MGCISSKQAKFDARHHPPRHHDHHSRPQRRHPHYQHSSSAFKAREETSDEGGSGIMATSSLHIGGGFRPLEKIKEEPEEISDDAATDRSVHHAVLANSMLSKKLDKTEKIIGFSFKFGRVTEVDAWPAWLSAVAGEAVAGWSPLKSDSFERLEKIGQGTYSSVYRARDLETGKMVALKKVRFDNFQQESVRFMAKEIAILRNLHHPNVMKLEGIITSQSSCNIYLVFEYMEHDLAGLLSCPDIKFSESEIKCYMKQLLSGVEYIHSRGVMHRDIKSSNILVNNDGIVKIADFGLATFSSTKRKKPLTSRVVTLWYRPPELLMGSTSYGDTVDLWSTGCVFAELFVGRPLFKGRTEVEQLHKIFKLCGSATEDYWRRSSLPLATMCKPQQPYESMLRERCKDLPTSAVDLIETFLSIEPYKRGTATVALQSNYFTTKPYPCDPSSIPKYPPNKEIDAKFREDARKRNGGSSRVSGASRNSRRSRNPLQDPKTSSKVSLEEYARRGNGGVSHYKGRASTYRASMKGTYDTLSEASQMTEESQNDSIASVPAQMSASRLYGQSNSRSHQYERRYASSVVNGNGSLDPERQANDEIVHSSKDYKDHQQRKYRSGRVPVRSHRPDARSHRPDARQEGEPRAAVRRSRFYRD